MKIDCHCHVFNNSCIPVKGLLQSRFGIVVGSKLFDSINLNRNDDVAARPDHLHRRFSLDINSLIGSLTDPAEKDSIRYLVSHPIDFIRFTLAGMKSMPDIMKAMMEKAPHIDIWVPLMMDTQSGYVGGDSTAGLDEQKRLMMEMTANEKGRLMPFFAYDPRSGPVDAVKTAIERDGFVGVKLYPPLGFKPCGNDDPRVEANLEDLYTYCSAGRVAPIPITAHCSWSDGVFSNRAVSGISNHKEYYRDMANPAHWKKVLERHANLKLDLAHFGGAGEWERRALSTWPVTRDRNWAETILQLMRDYEHVYTDLSFHGILVGTNGGIYGQALMEAIRGVEEKVLLGSDWYMSAIQCNLDDYWRHFAAAFPDLFDAMTGPNAIRFLQSEASRTFFPAFLSSRDGMDGQYVNLFQQPS